MLQVKMVNKMKMLFVATMLVAVMPSAFAISFEDVKGDLDSCTSQAASVGISCPAGTYFCGSDGCRNRDYLYAKFDLANKDGANWQATCYPKEAACGVSCTPESVACGSECKIPQENPACTEQGLSTDPCNVNNCGQPLAAPAIKHSEESSYPSDRPAIDIVQKGTGALLRILNNLGIGITISNAGDLETAGKVTGATGICIGADCIESWEQVKADWATLIGKPDNLVVGIGTEGRLARWGTDGIEDSIMTEAGNAIAVAGDVAVTGMVDAGEIISGDISGNKITAANGLEAAGLIKLSDLADCNTIDTDANGNLVCGDDDAGVGGSGTSDAIPKFDVTGKGIADSIIAQAAGNDLVQIAGGVEVSGDLAVRGFGNGIIFADNSKLVGAGGVISVGDANNPADLEVSGSLIFPDSSTQITAGITGIGTERKITKWTDDGGLTDSIITDNDNSISIAGNVFSSGYLSLAGLRFGGAVPNSPNVGNQGAVIVGSGEKTENINVEPGTIDFAPGNIILASAIDGKVGIGIADPKQKLDVAGNVRLADNLIYNSVDAAINWGPKGKLYFRALADQGDIGSSTNLVIFSADPKTGEPRIGIGTASAEQVLHVSGANEILSTGTGAGFKFRDRGSKESPAERGLDDWVWYARGSAIGTTARLYYEGLATDFIIVNQYGGIGIGKVPSIEDGKLQVAGYVQADNFIVTGVKNCPGKLITSEFGTLQCAFDSWSETTTAIHAQKKVGIGLASSITPAEKLEVAGNVKASGLISTGDVWVTGAGKITAGTGGVCINNICKTDWSQVGTSYPGLNNLGDGKVGIGTTSASTDNINELDVLGRVAVFGDTAEISVGDRYVAGSSSFSEANRWVLYSKGGELRTFRGGVGDAGITIKPDGKVYANLAYSGTNIVYANSNQGTQADEKRLLPADSHFCFLTYVGGKFQGAGENVRVYVKPDNYWYLRAEDLSGAGVRGEARCILSST